MNQLLEIWKKQQKWLQWAVIIGVLAIAAAIFSLNMRSGGMQVLYSNLGTSDAQAVEKQLMEMGVNFQITNNNTEIEVQEPSVKDVIQLRLKLAALGLPKFGNPGLSNFNTSIGTSQFTQNVQYTQALQSKLESDLTQINGVQSATINFPLTGASDSIFSNNSTPSSATVILTLMTGDQLTATQVKGVQNYVSSAFQGMKPGSVTVLDQNGDILSNGSSGSSNTTGGASGYGKELQITQDTENQIKNNLLGTLSPEFGYNNVRVTVAARINFDQVQQQIESYAPKGTLVSSQNQNSSSSSNNVTVQQPAGTQSNTTVPGYTTTNKGNGNSSKSKNSNLIQNWDVGKTVQTITKSPQLMNLDVTVVIAKPLNANQIKQLTTWVKVASGITNNGIVDVISHPFNNDTTSLTPPATATTTPSPTNHSKEIKYILDLLIAIVVIIILLGFVLILFRRRGESKSTPVRESLSPNPSLEEKRLEKEIKEELENKKTSTESLAEVVAKAASENIERTVEYISNNINEE